MDVLVSIYAMISGTEARIEHMKNVHEKLYNFSTVQIPLKADIINMNLFTFTRLHKVIYIPLILVTHSISICALALLVIWLSFLQIVSSTSGVKVISPSAAYMPQWIR